MVRFQTLDRYPEDAMSTPAQISANRQNSLLSTGPKTDAGKAASSQSALSHGLCAADPVLPHEDRTAFIALIDAYSADFNPSTAHEEFLVHEMAGARWKLDRTTRIENVILSGLLDSSNAADDPETKIAQAMSGKTGDPLARIERHRAALERTYHRCAREIRAAQKVQKEPNSQQLAEKKFDRLIKDYIFGPLPDELPPQPPPAQSKMQNEPKPVVVIPGPPMPRNREEWERNCQYALTNPALRL